MFVVLKTSSINLALLRTARQPATAEIEFDLVQWLDVIPSFIPDIQLNISAAVINSNRRVVTADAAIRETLIRMVATVTKSASVSIPLFGTNLDEHNMIHTQSIAKAIRKMLSNLHKAVMLQRKSRLAHFP